MAETRSPRRSSPRPARAAWPLLLSALALAAGCTTPPAGKATANMPGQAAPLRVGSDFAGVRRCFDNLLQDSGLHDLSVTVAEVVDPSPSAQASVQAMLLSAVSDLTQRSRAIRLTATGGAPGPAAPYALRATLGQEGGEPGAGGTVLALDLTLLSTQDMSLVPGTASHAAVTWVRGGADGERVELRKFGTQFRLPAGRDAGRTQATRTLLELGAMELFARLAKVPYWTCFGASATEASAAAEIQDWYDAMAARPNELIAFFQAALQRRRLYDGPVDGSVNPALKDAVARYREALGLSREPKLSLDFFKAYLGADPPPVEARLAAAPAAVASPVTQPATLAWNALPAEAKPALALQIATRNDTQRWARGEPVQLTIRPNRDAHVYCFHQDEDGRVTRFFPNRFRQDSWVPSATGVQLPGAMRFEIVMNRRGVPENLACFATPGDVLARLPAALGRPDFDALPVASLDALRSAFAEAAPGELAQQSIQLRPR